MRHSFLVSILLLAVIPAAAQSPKPVNDRAVATPPKVWTPPHTADGQPDLQGIWLNNSATPLERPKALEGRQFLTDGEVAELKKRADRLFKDGSADFAGGDNFFLAALANPDHYSNPNATGAADAMIEREFDNRTSLIVDPPDGTIPPLTAEGRKRSSRTPSPTGAGQRPASGPEDLSNALRCITYGVPRIGVANVNAAGPLGYYQIVQAPGYAVLTLEAIHETRIIPLDGRPHLPESIRQWSGDSRGRWDGNTLVVDTTNFSPKSNFMGSAENLHLVERFTRVAADRINYEITIDDPMTWTRSWTAVVHLKLTRNSIYEYACHEGNYQTMRGILGAARADDLAGDEAAKKKLK
jgi:hypothetical protein